MNHRMAAALFAASVTVNGAAGTAAQQGAPGPFSSVDARATVDKYCVTCHNERLKTAGLSLAKVDLQDPSADAPTLERVVQKLRTASMPPVGSPRPDRGTYQQLSEWLQ